MDNNIDFINEDIENLQFIKLYNICRKCKKFYLRNKRFLCNYCLKKKVI